MIATFTISARSFKGKFGVKNPNYNNSDKSVYISAEAIETDNYKTLDINQIKQV